MSVKILPIGTFAHFTATVNLNGKLPEWHIRRNYNKTEDDNILECTAGLLLIFMGDRFFYRQV